MVENKAIPELEEAIPDGDGEVVAGPVVALPQQQTVVLGAGQGQGHLDIRT